MSKDTADIVGTTGASFAVTTTAGRIVQAQLGVVNQPLIMLAVGTDGKSVKVQKLPSGDSTMWLAINWAPGDPNATVGVDTVTSGSARAATEPGILYDNDPVGVVELFGE